MPDVYIDLGSGLTFPQVGDDPSRALRFLVFGPVLGTPRLRKQRSRLEGELKQRWPARDVLFIDPEMPVRAASDDFDRMRAVVDEVSPDLVLWQVGLADALAATDPDALGDTLRHASHWLGKRGIRLLLIDPPFEPNVAHEPLFTATVAAIDAMAKATNTPLFRRYDAMQALHTQPSPAAVPDEPRACVPELLAEAIARAVVKPD